MAKHGKMDLDEIEATMNVIGGKNGARRLRAGELKLVPRDPQTDLLRPLGEPVICAAVSRFVAKDAFTKANGIAWMCDNFKQFILPVVEENVSEAALQVSELTRDTKVFRIAAELKVDEQGEVALTHFFRVLQDRLAGIWTDDWGNATFVIGTDGETWTVHACLGSGGWFVYANRLGNRRRWGAGSRLLSR